MLDIILLGHCYFPPVFKQLGGFTLGSNARF